LFVPSDRVRGRGPAPLGSLERLRKFDSCSQFLIERAEAPKP
jgi:hypothetical protein